MRQHANPAKKNAVIVTPIVHAGFHKIVHTLLELRGTSQAQETRKELVMRFKWIHLAQMIQFAEDKNEHALGAINCATEFPSPEWVTLTNFTIGEQSRIPA